MRCRDADALVRKTAFACLEALPGAALDAALGVADWQRLLEQGLLEQPEGADGKYGAEIRRSTEALLGRYLREGDEGVVVRLQTLLGSGGGGGTAAAVFPALAGIVTEEDVLEFLQQR